MIGTAVLLVAATALAADQPWEAAVEKAWNARDLVAAKVETRTEIFDGDGRKLEVVEEVAHLDGWSGDEPLIGKERKRTVFRKSGMRFEMSLSANANPLVAAHDGRVSISRRREENSAGCRCVIYSFEERPADSKGQVAVGEVWIDSALGAAVKVVYRFREMPANVSSYVMTLGYTTSAGQWAPATVHMEAAGGFLFFHRMLKVDKTFSGWTRKADNQTARR